MKNSIRRFVALLFIGLLPAAVWAQTGSVRGFVYDKETGEPIIFTNVYLKGTTTGSSTDVNGYFSITKVPVGNYDLTVSYLGYDTLSKPINVVPNGIVNEKLYIAKASIKLGVVEVSADKQEARTDVRTSVVKLTPKEMKQIPTVSGESDLAQVLQVQPGVVFTGDQGGQLYIRGGSPIQNKVLLDGMVIYNPFHSIGFFSVFDTDIIRSADIYTGGYNAEFGDRISSIMDIHTRDGNKKKFSGKISASPFGANLLLEGPMIKLNEEKGTSLTYLLSTKLSYLEQTSKVLYPYADSLGLPFNFYDGFGKIAFNGGNGSKISLFGFSFNDQVTYQALSNYQWNSWGIGTNFLVVPGSSTILMEGFVNYSTYRIGLTEPGQDERYSSIGGFNGGMNFTYFIGKHELKFGPFVQGFTTTYEFTNSVGQKIGAGESQNNTDFGIYAKFKLNLLKERVVLEPSFRFHYYASLAQASPEPRLGLKVNITKWMRFKYAFGLFAQNLISANSDRDVVNLFYGFLNSPENLPSTFDGNEVNNPLQRAMHNIAGVEVDLGKRVSLNLEGYYKDFFQLSNVNRNKRYPDTPEFADRDDTEKKDFIIETGKAYGFDMVAKYDYKRLYIWAVYSLMWTTRFDGVNEYFPFFDRRHNVNLVLSYTFGKNLNWEVSGRWNYGSGFPFTQTAGFYENVQFDNGIGTDYVNNNGLLGVQYGELNKGRLTDYHRFDVNVKRKFEIGKTDLELNLGITNIYNRRNIFYIDRVTNEQVYQLPILPSLGVSWKW